MIRIPALLLALLSSLTASDYHVAGAGGDDDADGLTPATAWASLLPLAQRELAAGDAVWLRRGARIIGGVVVGVAGSEEAPVRIGAYGADGDGAPLVTTEDPAVTCLLGLDGSHATVAGIAFAGIPHSGIWISPTSRAITVEHCDFRSLAYGVWTSGSGTRVRDCRFADLVMVADTPGPDDDAGAVAVAVNGSDTEIAWCEMSRCRAPSADYGHDGGAVEVWAEQDSPVRGLHVHHNRIRDCEGVLEIGGWEAPEVADLLVERNAISGCGQMFLTLHLTGGDSRFGVALAEVELRHNTIVQSGSGWYGIWSSRDDVTLPVRLVDNLIVLRGAKGLTNAAGLDQENNLFHRGEAGREAVFAASIGRLLRDAPGGDLRLAPDSPAIDAALRSGSGVDLDRRPVPQGAAADIGAYEAPAP